MNNTTQVLKEVLTTQTGTEHSATDSNQEKVPEQVQSMEEVLTEEVLNQDSSLTDTHWADNRRRSSQNKRKQVSSGADGQSIKTGAERKIGAKKARKTGAKTGADGTGTEITQTGAKQVRGQGKRGADKKPRKIRYDNSPMTAVALDDRSRIVRHNLELFNLGTLKDRNDEIEVQERIQAYFEICAKNSVMPTVAGFAMALGIDRSTLWLWMDNRTGVIKNPAVLDVLKRIYSMINTQYEELLTEGKIIPVGAFFLLQNNHGYRNQTDHVVVAQPAEEPNTDDIAARAGLLDGEDT